MMIKFYNFYGKMPIIFVKLDMDKTTSFRFLGCVNKRLLFIMGFGFFSGLPFALAGSTLQAWLTEAKVDLLTIGALSLVSFPYNCKFLWAPLLDRFIFSALGRRRGWILLTQLGIALTLWLLAMIDPQEKIHLLVCLVLLLTFISATQDIAVDAYRADTLLPAERGLGAAYAIFAYRIALFASGGLALVVASFAGWAHTYQLMAIIMLLGMAITCFAPEKPLQMNASHQGGFFFAEPFLELWSRDNIVLITAFIVLYKAGAALSVALMTNFLLKGLGFSLIEIGVASKTVIIVATLLGSLVGGIVLARLSLYAALLWFGLAQAVSILLFMLLAIVGKLFSLMVLAIFVENFCSGMSTAALMAFLMSLCHARFSATQFAFFSAIDSLVRLFAGPLAATLVLHGGWVFFYGESFVLSFPALLLLILLRKRVFVNAQALSFS